MFRLSLVVFNMVLVTVHCESIIRPENYRCPNIKTDLKVLRKRRHLTFPDGSNAGITISLAKSFHTHAPSGWMMTSDLDVLYPLPDAKFTNAHFRRKLHHRQKREFWERIRNVLHLHNMNGNDCVLRSICEAKAHLAPPGKSLVHDILRAIFTAPIHEEDFIQEMAGNFNDIMEPNFCDRLHDCPFSIIHFILELNKRK